MQIRLFFIGILLSLFASCATQDSKPIIVKTTIGTYQQFRASYRDYTVHIPAGWTVKEHSKSGTVRAADEANEATYGRRLVILALQGRLVRNKETGEMQQKEVNLASFADTHLANLSTHHTDFKAIETLDVTLNGEKAKKCVYEYVDTTKGKETVKVLSYILAQGAEAFVINCVDKAEKFAASQPLFEEVCQSFTFVEPKVKR